MPHVELSLTDAPGTRQRGTAESSLVRWGAAVAKAGEPCLVLDARAAIVAVSHTAAGLLGLGEPEQARGKQLREAADPLVDFTAAQEQLDEAEASQIPPLLAIASGRITRGLIRVRSQLDGRATTMDTVATPLTDGGRVVGSLTFLAAV